MEKKPHTSAATQHNGLPRQGKCCSQLALFAADAANLFVHLSGHKCYSGRTSHMISSSHEDQQQGWEVVVVVVVDNR